MGYAIENGLLNIPQSFKLPHPERILPYVFIGDDAFGLKKPLDETIPIPTFISCEESI